MQFLMFTELVSTGSSFNPSLLLFNYKSVFMKNKVVQVLIMACFAVGILAKIGQFLSDAGTWLYQVTGGAGVQM